MISYQNLATYCERQGDAGQQERYLSQAYAYMEGLLLYPRTSARVRFVALEYLEIALKELGTVLERADRVDELETLLTAHVQLVDGACSSSGDGLRSRDHPPLFC